MTAFAHVTHVASPTRTVRNHSAAVGGNLAACRSGSLDWLATMAVLDAAIVVRGQRWLLPAYAYDVRRDRSPTLRSRRTDRRDRSAAPVRWCAQGLHHTSLPARPASSPVPIGAAMLDERSDLARVVTGATGGAPIELPRTAPPRPRRPAPRPRSRSLRMSWLLCAVPRPTAGARRRRAPRAGAACIAGRGGTARWPKTCCRGGMTPCMPLGVILLW